MTSASKTPLDALIRKLESIAHLSAEEKRALQSLPAMVRDLGPGQDIVRDRDRPSQCCLVLEGWTYRYRLLSEGKRQILSFHVPCDIPDLLSLHLPIMDHSLCTLEKAKLAFIPHEDMRDLIRRFPNVGMALWRDTLVDAAIFREWMVGMGRRSAYQRIAHLFCELYFKLEAVGQAHNLTCQMPLTQMEMADALGLSTVHINRVLQELRENGIITLKSRTLVIRNWEELQKTGEFDPLYLHATTRRAA